MTIDRMNFQKHRNTVKNKEKHRNTIKNKEKQKDHQNQQRVKSNQKQFTISLQSN